MTSHISLPLLLAAGCMYDRQKLIAKLRYLGFRFTVPFLPAQCASAFAGPGADPDTQRTALLGCAIWVAGRQAGMRVGWGGGYVLGGWLERVPGLLQAVHERRL